MNPIPSDLSFRGRIRTIYADLDGTLLGPRGSLFRVPDGHSTRAAEAVGRLHAGGVELVLVSGRTREQMREAARILSAGSYVAEIGAFVVRRGDPDEVIENLGAFEGPGSPYEAMARSGAGAFLLERYRGRLEPHTPWSFEGREATMLFRGLLDVDEADAALAAAGYRWLEVLDNGLIPRAYDSLDVPEVRAYHLVPRGVSKATGVAAHMHRFGIAPEEAVAVGDSLSDLELANEVTAVFIVANGLAGIGGRGDGVPNAYATPSPAGDGFSEAVSALLG